MGNKVKILLGLAGAATAGVALGMLLAPEKGKDMRRKISKKASDLADDFSNTVSERKEQFNQAKNQIIEEAKGLRDDVETRFHRVKESLQGKTT